MNNLILALFFFISIVVGAIASARNVPPFSIHRTVNNSGQSFIMIKNNTTKQAYCTISADNYFVDFYVASHGNSRYYQEPYGYYRWRCV